MAEKQFSRIGRKYSPVFSTLKVATLRMATQDISNWKTAIDSAKNATNPKRKQLLELYESIMLDGHLLSVVNKRIIAITNKKVLFQAKGKEGEINEAIQDSILETPWFYDLLKHAMESVAWGHSLIELVPEAGEISRVELIPRINVKPETGIILLDPSNDKNGIYYRDDPRQGAYLIEVGGRKDYGLLMSAAQYVIYKRGGFGDWAQFTELFGQPFRVGTYNPFNDSARRDLETALTEMGGAAWAVIPEGAKIDIKDSAGATGRADIFKELINLCDQQLSKIILGQTMTTDNGSSRSQSEVHKEVEEDINLSDMIHMEYILNWNVKPKLVDLGRSDLKDGRFQFEKTKTLPLEKQIDIAVKVSEKVPIAEEWWYKTFGIQKPDGKAKPSTGSGSAGEDQEDEDQEEPETNNQVRLSLVTAEYCINEQLNDLYGSCNHGTIINASKKPDKIMQAIAKGVHEGKIKPGQVDKDLYNWIAGELFGGVIKGFGGGFDKYEKGKPDYKMLAFLENNVHVFSAFKTYHQLREFTNALTDKDGNLRDFSNFKAEVDNISDKYNITWLQSEYNQAVASSQMASRWVNIQENKEDLPLLKYETVGDDRVREAHAAIDGIVKPVDDSFWNTYYPPNDWGCRCDVLQLHEGKTTDTSKKELPLLKPMFRTNSAKDGVVFPEKHPYFKVEKEHQGEAKKLWSLKIPNKVKRLK